ncbi:alpha/beta-Hydrolase [Pochonia chlamydosporia 170]|uniref:Alpha/beta-Hydrolase n=1 Tax=Pochonia chlamydosporia 170 TaxID=1380566 RepID=A0A179FH30_METCM|nr:alpha/beta-Hydrolase [Pochonia chlamydosporia 170]OAQ64717.1 alpha/beta-Hydrolase [Pochonia chlamydosporia 170]
MSVIIGAIAVIIHLLKPTKAEPNSPATCIDLSIPITVSANNTVYDTPRIDSSIDVADWMWDMYTWSHANLTSRVNGTIHVKETFNISGKLCVPHNGRKADILQIATHGIAFDKWYWDVQHDRQAYNYIDAALKNGYSILTYDRIGNGRSSKPNAYTVAQSPVEVEVLREITNLVRSGNLIAASKANASAGKVIRAYIPKKVVHVGHSFGSVTTAGMLSQYGHLSDGALLTGFIPGSKLGVTRFSEFGYEYAPEHDARRFGDRSSGYVVQATKTNIQQLFLKKGSFEPELLRYAEAIKQTASVGEMLSGGAFVGHAAPSFSGPVQFFLGEYDVPICAGDCKNTYDMEVLKKLYPKATDVSVYLQPETGHGLTLSRNATAGYDVMFSYLEEHGL